MLDKQRAKVARVNKLMTYMNYDWDSDVNWKQYLTSQKLSLNLPKDQQELAKRAYYSLKIDKEFEKTFEFTNEEDRKAYFTYCAFFGNLSSLAMDSKQVQSQRARQIKHAFYFLFFLAIPLKIPFTPMLFLAAAIASIYEKQGALCGGQQSWAKLFMDEELMNLGLLLMMIFSGPIIRFFLYICLIMWSFLMWCEWAFEVLQENPQAPGLPILRPVIEFGLLFRVEIVKIKNHIELLIGIASVYMIFTGRIAPIFPVFYWQYLRIKYVVNSFMKNSFEWIDQSIIQRVIPGFLYKNTLEPLKNKLYYFVNYNNQGAAAADDDVDDDRTSIVKKNQ